MKDKDANMKKLKICLVSLGCPKNLVDSEVMLGILKESGHEIAAAEDEADAIVVNTCGFIGDAKEESIDAILSLAERKRTGRCRRLIVTGCLSQRYKDELAKELPEVDCFIGTGEYSRIGEAIEEGFKERVLVGLPTYLHDHDTPRLLATPSHYAYVKVAEGCSNMCSYCSIPSIRGTFRSRSVESVVREAESLALQGVREINLVAQDTTSYGLDRGTDLVELVRGLIPVKGIEWIRLLYLYPGRITDELLAVMRGEEKLLAYIDLPLQHISPRILEAMNRRYSRKDVEGFIEKLRRDVDGVALRTSMIVGFPGETDREFKELLDFAETVRFERLGVFSYSREEGTAAYGLKKQVPEKVKAERLGALMEAQRPISLEANERLVGSVVRVLVEGTADEEGYALKGRTEAQAPDVDGVVYLSSGKAAPGELVTARVIEAQDYDLVAELV